MDLQEFFYITASIFFLVSSVVVISLVILGIAIYQRVNHLISTLGETISVSNRYILKAQQGIYGTLLGLIRMFSLRR